MDDKELGLRIQRLREESGLSREAFCLEESELTTRQLTRIELGQSKPTFAKINYIANRLGKSLFEIMPDYVVLPNEYMVLKYDILRQPTYGQQGLIDEKLLKLDEIYKKFYRQLPDREQLIIDILQSIYQAIKDNVRHYQRDEMDEMTFKTVEKDEYDVADLLLIRRFASRIYNADLKENSDEYKLFNKMLDCLPKQMDLMIKDEYFILRDVILVVTGAAGKYGWYENFEEIIETLERIMEATQDFQKMPIIKLISWKYQLFHLGNRDEAEKNYREAVLFANMTNQSDLLKQLKKDWEINIKNFESRK